MPYTVSLISSINNMNVVVVVGVPVTEVEANLKALLLQRGGGSRPHTPTGAQGGPHKHIPHLGKSSRVVRIQNVVLLNSTISHIF